MGTKIGLFGMLLLLSLNTSFGSSSAEEAQVSITSFDFIGSTHIAELCGKVTGKSAALSEISVTVDAKSASPGYYNTIADKNGHFCLLAATGTGSAEVALLLLGKDFSPVLGTARHESRPAAVEVNSPPR